MPIVEIVLPKIFDLIHDAIVNHPTEALSENELQQLEVCKAGICQLKAMVKKD